MRFVRPILICAVFAGTVGVPLLGAEFSHKSQSQASEAASYEAIAQRQGEAYAHAVDFERAGAAWSAQARAGEALITVTLTPPENAWLRTKEGRLVWTPPPQGTVHLRAFVADTQDGRFVPGLSVHARVFDDQGQSLGSDDLPFGLYPLTDAYGANVTLPPEAVGLAIYIDTLTASRDGDGDADDRFNRPIRAQFALQGVGPMTGEMASARAEHAPEALLSAQSEAFTAARVLIGAHASGAGEIAKGDILLDYAIAAADTERAWPAKRPGASQAGEQENARLDVIPRDTATGRFLPGVKITATVEAYDGTASRTAGLPLRWSPWLHRYAENWVVPGSRAYQLKLQISPPEAPRYGTQADHWLDEPVELTITRDGVRTTQN